jgi:hypothetical protein
MESNVVIVSDVNDALFRAEIDVPGVLPHVDELAGRRFASWQTGGGRRSSRS